VVIGTSSVEGSGVRGISEVEGTEVGSAVIGSVEGIGVTTGGGMGVSSVEGTVVVG